MAIATQKMKSAIAFINSLKDFVSKGGPNVIALVKKGTKRENKNIEKIILKYVFIYAPTRSRTEIYGLRVRYFTS